MAEEYLKVENLYKNYGNIKAVNNVSFSAKKDFAYSNAESLPF